MKKIALLLLTAAVVTTGYQCKPTGDKGTKFTFSIEPDDPEINLPALHSFGFGTTDSCWLMVGGRTNGFHGFGNDQNFPAKKANLYIYAYNTYTQVLDSMSIDVFDSTLRLQFAATNMPSRQVGNYLYMAGGYGKVNDDTLYTSWQTHGILSRIDVPRMIRAIQSPGHDDSTQSAAYLAAVDSMRAAVVYLTNPAMASTGGELFKMDDGNFYLCVGHNFTGAYSSNNATQVYLDEVRVFSLTETENSIAIAGAIDSITDGLNDTVTQFHRRDLVVAPNVMPGGNTYGISIYGGVFTYTSGCPSCNGGNPFRNPIYITPGANPAYTVDNSYRQMSNIYSAPNLQMYDSKEDMMFTTIFGGLGDTTVPNGDSASFSTQILTVARNKNMQSSAIYNPTGMPTWVGSEGIFVLANDVPLYNNNVHDIIDFNKLKKGKQLLGYIYGGILSDNVGWSSGNPTIASCTVYKVYVDVEKK